MTDPDTSNWYVILTETGVESVWPNEKDAADWYYGLARRGLLTHDSVLAPFDPGDDAHWMAARFSPQLNQR